MAREVVLWRARLHYRVEQPGMSYSGVLTCQVEAPENDIHAAGHAAWICWSNATKDIGSYLTSIDVKIIEQPKAPALQATLWQKVSGGDGA